MNLRVALQFILHGEARLINDCSNHIRYMTKNIRLKDYPSTSINNTQYCSVCVLMIFFYLNRAIIKTYLS